MAHWLIDWLIWQYLSAHLEGDVIKFPAVAQRRPAGINQSGRGSGSGGQTFPRPPAVFPAARRTFGALGAHFPFRRLLPRHGHLFSCGWDEHFCVSSSTLLPVEFREKATEVQPRVANIPVFKKGVKLWRLPGESESDVNWRQLLSRRSSWMAVNASSASLCKHLSLLPPSPTGMLGAHEGAAVSVHLKGKFQR